MFLFLFPIHLAPVTESTMDKQRLFYESAILISNINEEFINLKYLKKWENKNWHWIVLVRYLWELKNNKIGVKY